MNKRKGITLVALVVTIIVLLILASVSIALLIGPNGMIKKAQDSKIKGRIATVKDRVTVWRAGNETKRKIGEEVVPLPNLIDTLVTEGIVTEEERDNMEMDNGKLVMGEETIYIYNPILSEVNIGDTVIYNPTIGAKVPQLTYTSRVGSAEARKNVSGNGHSVQTFTATSSDDQWIVLGKENGQLKLMSAEPKIRTTGTGLTVQWGQGWLYIEEELHRICSIYGYGKGADKNQITIYQIGNYEIDGEVKTKTLKGSGARSITLDDLQEVTNINLRGNSDTNNPPEATKVYMPSLNGVNPEGKCVDENKKSKIPSTTIWITKTTFDIKEKYQGLTKDMIYKNTPYYWLASRSVLTDTASASFRICGVDNTNIGGSYSCYGSINGYNNGIHVRGIRPIVYLEPLVELNSTGANAWIVVQE